jgi:putative hydrolases of HD superfamily
MLDNDFKQQLKFIEELEKLKTVNRQNGILGNSRYENSTEHSWHSAIMALILYQNTSVQNLDILKVVKLLLIHDIVEIDAGDNFVFNENEIKEVKEKENKAAIRIFNLLPNSQNNEFLSLWREFEEQKTPETKYSQAMDKLQPLINHLVTAKENENTNNLTKSMIIKMKSSIKDTSLILWEIAKELINNSIEKGLYKKE